MTKTEWEEAYQEFDEAYSELVYYERDYKYGSNKEVRSKAERQMGYVEHRIGFLFRKYPEVYDILTGGEANSAYHQGIILDEFFQNRYIVGDLSNLLLAIKEKIASLEKPFGISD